MNSEELESIVSGGYKWIKVKRHVDDTSASAEARLDVLQKHHIDETTFLLNKCRELAGEQLAVRKIIGEWVAKQGHDRCWYYPELFKALAEVLQVDVSFEPDMPREELERGCKLFHDDIYKT